MRPQKRIDEFHARELENDMGLRFGNEVSPRFGTAAGPAPANAIMPAGTG
jgi:hypothetical protein